MEKLIDFTKCKIGTKVWDIDERAWGIIVNVTPLDNLYTIVVSFGNNVINFYDRNGKTTMSSKYSSLFFEEIKIPLSACVMPNPMPEIDSNMILEYETPTGLKRYNVIDIGDNDLVTIGSPDEDIISVDEISTDIARIYKWKSNRSNHSKYWGSEYMIMNDFDLIWENKI